MNRYGLCNFLEDGRPNICVKNVDFGDRSDGVRVKNYGTGLPLIPPLLSYRVDRSGGKLITCIRIIPISMYCHDS